MPYCSPCAGSAMIEIKQWPPPEAWTPVVVTWEALLATKKEGTARQMLKWLETFPGTGRYHTSGYNSTEGFLFLFENPKDATIFMLVWGNIAH